MKPLLTPKLDFVFKKLFTADTAILKDLLNSILKNEEGSLIKNVEIRNPIILPDEITQKFIILDILAQDENKKQYDIEIQVRNYAFYSERALYYLCRLYAEQLDSGEYYEKLKPVIGIHFLDYEHFPDYDDFYLHFELIDGRFPKLRLTDDLSLYIFELPKVERLLKSGWQGDKIKEWLHFFNHAHQEDNIMRTQYKNPAIQNAFQILEMLSADEKTRHLAEVREKALKNERSELAAARQEGELQGRKEGELKGRKEGEIKGRTVLLLNLLKKKFNKLPKHIENTILKADIAILDKFGEAIFDFNSIKDVEKWLEKNGLN